MKQLWSTNIAYFLLKIVDFFLKVDEKFDLLVSGTESEDPSISSDDTKTNTEKSFRDNFIDKNIDDKDSNSDTNGNADLPTSNFEPMKDSKEYIGMKWNSTKIWMLDNLKDPIWNSE